MLKVKGVTSEKGHTMQEENERRQGGDRNQWTLLDVFMC
jgi:hypothetical protein